MPLTRRAVLVALADATDAQAEETTTIDALGATLDVDRDRLETHLHALVSCELARWEAEGCVRVTTTGEELLALNVDDAIVVPPPAEDS